MLVCSSVAFLVSQVFEWHDFVVKVGVVPTGKCCSQLIVTASKRWKQEQEALCSFVIFFLLLL